MKASYKWLREYVDTELTPNELDNLLTFSGLEIEGVEKVESIKGGLEHVVIAQVLTCENHPDSDHLHLTTVDVGGDRPLEIVCGAPNVAAGQKVVCATIGTKIYTSDTEFYEIKKGKLRGKVSEGMLCAADELQLGSSHDGIMVLPDDAPVGMPAKEYFHLEEDYTLEVAITANRSDATSHIGVARDIVAVLNTREGANKKINWPEVADLSQAADTTANPIKVTVERPDLCPRYTGITMENVKVCDSPKWLQDKLRTIGIRPINNIVDITNFVLMEVGQPMHAFDADKIAGNHVIVKTLPQDTPFVTLDGVERKLDERDLMICNEQEGMCIAGVFGGEKSGITNQTTRVFLESAYFNPMSIRKTSKRHTLKTDASFRYERGCDPNITMWALQRAVKLMQELAGATVASKVVDVYPQEIKRAEVDINFDRITRLVGQEIPVDAIRTALTSLDIEIASETAEGMHILIPTCKVDVYRECDVVEEIMRIYGYNNIHVDERISSCLSFGQKPNPRRLQNIVSDLLTDNGFSEIMNNSLTKAEYFENNPDFDPANSIQILNPLSKELNVMRQTLLYSGMECVVRNLNYKIQNQKLYEFGRTYQRAMNVADITEEHKVTDKFAEVQHLSIFMTGNMTSESWMGKPAPVDFYQLKLFVMNIMRRMRMNITRLEFVPAKEKFYAEGIDIVFRDSKKQLCSMGRLSKDALKRMDCKQDVYYADFDWTLLLKSYPSKEVMYAEVPKFPEVRRDLALILDKKITFAEIERVAYATEKKLLKRVSLFDVYEGKGITEGMKSYAVSFILQDKEKTLNDKQIETVMAKLQKNLESQLNAHIRQ
ncbi:MAG: phenylalanine--tRNA ligase subunit beta [Bacteroidales bacterium]|nr:phenylalanine--tRNA ligase subunit beta [Bacteroidales bacterium]